MASTGKEPIGSTSVESSACVAMETKLMLSTSHTDCQKLKDLLNKESDTAMVAVMAFSKGKKPSSLAAGAKAPTVAMDAKLIVSTGHGESEKLKNLLNKKDATLTMVVMRTSCNQDSEANPSLNILQLRLLAAASEGDLRKLKSLLSRTSQETAVNVLEDIFIPAGQGKESIIPAEEGINVAALTSSQLKVVTSAEGDTKYIEVIIPVEHEGITVTAPSAASSLLKVFTAEGDTALHLVAANGAKGGSEEFERCAKFIHEKDTDLLYEKNNKGETPLHCAARVGKSQLVSCLIGLAKDDGKVKDLLRMVNNNNETALHEAVRRGDTQMVKELLRADPELASFPRQGTSPLYLAILLMDDRAILWKEDRQAGTEVSDAGLKKNEEKSMVQTLYDESKDGFLSYFGPNGQNALHAAVLRGPVLTRKLLRWKNDLTIQRDENGSTPLHFAAGIFGALRRRSVCSTLLEANPEALYQLDNNGLSPIHVAAYVGAFQAVALFVEKCPSSAGLRDAKGRTFLHVTVENMQVWAVYQACNSPSLAWIMNMQDNDGNTALHLAIKAGSLLMFSALFATRNVRLNITNAEGQTPLDIAQNKIPATDLLCNQNSEIKIRDALKRAGAHSGASRRDHFDKNHQVKGEDESKRLEKLKDMTQTQSIASVLIATAAFGATFALPGGYRADDHSNGGTPTLAGTYAFDAFMMANTLAFIFSVATIICIACGGSPMFNRHSRIIYLAITFIIMRISVTCFTAAFALGVFTVLSPVAHKTAVAICVMSPLVVLCNNAEFWLKCFLLAPSYWVRKGPVWTVWWCIWLFLGNMLYEFWPFLLIFIWPAYGRAHPISQVERLAQPPPV